MKYYNCPTIFIFIVLFFHSSTGKSQQLTEFSATLDVIADFDSIAVQTYSIPTKKGTDYHIRSESQNKVYLPIYEIDYVSFYGILDGNYSFLYQGWVEGDSVVIDKKVIEDEFSYYLSKNKFTERQSMDQQKIAQADTLNKEALFFVLIELLNKVKNTPYAAQVVSDIQYEYPNDTDKHYAAYQVIKNQDEDLKRTVHMESLFDYFERPKLDTIILSDYELKSFSPPSQNLENNNKKITIIDFWHSGCAPCIADHKLMVADTVLTNEYNIIGISTDSQEEDWRKYLIRKPLPWKNYWESKTAQIKLSDAIGIVSFPTYLILDRNHARLTMAHSYEELKLVIKGAVIVSADKMDK